MVNVMRNIDVNFTKEQVEILKSMVTLEEDAASVSKDEKTYNGKLTREYFLNSSENIINSQRNVFRAITGDFQVDYGNASFMEALPIIEAFAPYNNLKTGRSSNEPGKVVLSRENYKDILKEIATNLIKAETGVEGGNVVAAKDGEIINFNFKGFEPSPVEKPEKPGLFKRFLHAVFGAYKQEFAEYEQKLADYNMTNQIINNKEYQKVSAERFDKMAKEFGTSEAALRHLSIDEHFREEVSFDELMYEENIKSAPTLEKPAKSLVKQKEHTFEM